MRSLVVTSTPAHGRLAGGATRCDHDAGGLPGLGRENDHDWLRTPHAVGTHLHSPLVSPYCLKGQTGDGFEGQASPIRPARGSVPRS